jgi:hypothetical protein
VDLIRLEVDQKIAQVGFKYLCNKLIFKAIQATFAEFSRLFRVGSNLKYPICFLNYCSVFIFYFSPYRNGQKPKEIKRIKK